MQINFSLRETTVFFASSKIKKLAFIIIIIVITVIIVILLKPKVDPQTNKPSPQPEPNTLTIISTKPNLLDGATVVIEPVVELTFNKPLESSNLKFRFEPEMEVNLVGVGQHTIRITFKNPLELNRSYTLVVLTDTKTKDGLNLDKEYTFKFRTINYSGV